jgi:hypothetical protein
VDLNLIAILIPELIALLHLMPVVQHPSFPKNSLFSKSYGPTRAKIVLFFSAFQVETNGI